MAKVSQRNEHDWLGFTVTFADKSKLQVTWSRGAGEKVKVTPEDRAVSRAVAIALWEANARVKAGGAPYGNLGDIQKIGVAVGEKAASLGGFVADFTKALGVTGRLPKLDPGPAASGTVVAVKVSRGGHVVEARFPSGEHAELTLNKASVGLRMAPDVSAYQDELMSFAFAAKGAGVIDADGLAEAFRSSAEAAGSVEEWIDGVRQAVFPTPSMGR